MKNKLSKEIINSFQKLIRCLVQMKEGKHIMHHKLDVKPIPEQVLYINEIDLVSPDSYQTIKEYEKVLMGKTVSNGGILPDDNVRIYIPMDLNADAIMKRLYQIYGTFGSPSEDNESAYNTVVRQLVSQLEIYDQVWAVGDMEHAVQKENGGILHSEKGIGLARKIVEYLSEDEGSAECFPFEIIDELRESFWL